MHGHALCKVFFTSRGMPKNSSVNVYPASVLRNKNCEGMEDNIADIRWSTSSKPIILLQTEEMYHICSKFGVPTEQTRSSPCT
jgi:hypothetical protein